MATSGLPALAWLLPVLQFQPWALAWGPSVEPYLWLEAANDTRVMAWVKQQNSRTLAAVGDPAKSPLLPKVLKLLQTNERIPSVDFRRNEVYNFWYDDRHLRGVWRRTSLEEFRKSSPAWEVVLDMDTLAGEEGVPWVWKGCSTLSSPSEREDLCLMRLSRGGSDAKVIREFNLTSKTFVPPPLGFVLPEAKTSISYLDRDTVLVGTNCGNGSLTESGFPRKVLQWRRGTDLCSSPTIFEGQTGDVSASAHRQHGGRGHVYDWQTRRTSFYDFERAVRIVSGEGSASDFVRLEVPSKTKAAIIADQLLLTLQSDFAVSPSLTLRSGTVAATPLAPFLAGNRSTWVILFSPTANRSCDQVVTTRDYVVLKVLDAVRVQLISWRYTLDGRWEERRMPLVTATVRVSPVHWTSNAVWITSQGFLQPPVLSLAPSAGQLGVTEELKSMPSMFDASGLQVSQQWAVSKDGTRVPYFLVNRKGSPSNQPTILYGYGGFAHSLLPYYSRTLGALWLESGGAYALANIRGGGEFGPGWHQSAVREGKHRSYEDFAAVARHLVDSGVTSREKLAAVGGSNGGLLVGNMLVQSPHLFSAIVCQVPLLDMWRYNKLSAGASWVAEYGNPDVPSDWAFLRHISPYHNVNASVAYPPVLFMTSTRDDRVHPAHARKMAARMQAEAPGSAARTLFFETTEGGHRGGLPRQQAAELALWYTFLAGALGLDIGAHPRRLARPGAEVLV